MGKTFLIRQQLPGVRIVDLLDSEVYARLVRRPKLLDEEMPPETRLVVIDEIQRLPELLNEVQRLIQERDLRFLMTGSSARKLRRREANLLGGRAWSASLFPLCFPEIPDLDPVFYFNRGGLPPVCLSANPAEELRAYVDLYLRQEIQAEALTRNLGGFARFLDVMALQNGEELNFQGLSNDVGMGARTLQNYLQILEDTLLGFQVPAFRETRTRKAISRSKFYFFDIGVVNVLAQRGQIQPRSELFGRCLEHWLMLELRAYLSYRRRPETLGYWRSTSGYEVDAVIGREWALEFKATDLAAERHLKGLKALREEGLIRKFGMISTDPAPRTVDGIAIMPWKAFLKDLWSDRLFEGNPGAERF